MKPRDSANTIMASRTLVSSIKSCKLKVNCKSNVLPHLFKNYSTDIQVNAVDAVCDNNGAQDLYKSERDIPFMFLPHTVKKAYHVHETSLTLPKIFDKYKWLTKTVSTPGLPPAYHASTHDESQNKELLRGFHDSLFQTVAYVKAYNNQKLPRYIPERINFSMLSNFLRLSMGFGEDAVHLRPESSYLYHEPVLETHWPRNYKFYQTKFRPTFVLRSTNGFGCLETPQALSPEDIERLPGPYEPYAINLYRQHIVHLLNRPAMDNSKFNPIKHCHTTIMQNNKMIKLEQFLSLGVMTMFAQLLAQAQADGALHGTELKQPLVTQCIVTNGHRTVFMVYQLNTLHLLHDKGIWNRCWYSPMMEMFERQEYEHYYMIYEDAETGPQLKGFNEECCTLFTSFIRKETI